MADDSSPSVIDAVLRAGERFGVPVVLLAVVLWLIRDAAITLHGTVLVPIVKSHTEFLDSTRETLDGIGQTQRQQAQTMQQQAKTLEELAVGQSEIKAAVIRKTGQVQGQN